MNRFSSVRLTFIFSIIIFLAVNISVLAETFKAETVDSSYQHDRWKTSCSGILRDFAAFRSCFQSPHGKAKEPAWGQPQWVAYEIKRLAKTCVKTGARPGKWFGDPNLIQQRLMPSDESYGYSKTFLAGKRDWFSRGHLCMKMHGERLGAAQGWNTHTFFNAVPQRQLFNAGIWLDLEYLTAAWAQQYGSVWIIDGPIFADKTPSFYIGEAGEIPVAVPEALFKIVIKEGIVPDQPDVLAFIYPQVGAGYYNGKPYNHLRYLTTLSEVEKLTGVDFLSRLPLPKIRLIKKTQADGLWPVEKRNFLPVCGGSGKLND